jgi:hypothetical protein
LRRGSPTPFPNRAIFLRCLERRRYVAPLNARPHFSPPRSIASGFQTPNNFAVGDHQLKVPHKGAVSPARSSDRIANYGCTGDCFSGKTFLLRNFFGPWLGWNVQFW